MSTEAQLGMSSTIVTIFHGWAHLHCGLLPQQAPVMIAERRRLGCCTICDWIHLALCGLTW